MFFKMQNENPAAMCHPERGQRPRRSFGSEASRNGQNQAPWRAGIYKGVFVTFHGQSYFSLQIGGSETVALRMCANTYFDTICVQVIKMRTVKLSDKLEFDTITI